MRKMLTAIAVAGLVAGLNGGQLAAAAPQEAMLVRVQMMCTKSGERVSGMNKICSYDCGGSEATQTVSSTDLCPMNMRTRNTAGSSGGFERRTRGAACMKTGERLSGLNRVCSYDCSGSGREITVGSGQLCPTNPR